MRREKSQHGQKRERKEKKNMDYYCAKDKAKGNFKSLRKKEKQERVKE